jgi:RNA polymerase sigma-70 factor (ECF subfamily)
MDSTSPSLLDRLRCPNDNEAWARFVQLYTPLLFHWLRRAGLRQHETSDLIQEVFLQLLRKLPTFQYDQTRSFRAWLRTVTLNRLRDRWKRRIEAPLAEESPALADQAGPNEASLFVEDEYRQQVTARALELMQTEFAPTTWKACWEQVVAGRSAVEVAAELGLTVGAVYAARFRVLARLRREFEGLLD